MLSIGSMGTNFNEIWIKVIKIIKEKCFWKCCLHYIKHFVQASIYWKSLWWFGATESSSLPIGCALMTLAYQSEPRAFSTSLLCSGNNLSITSSLMHFGTGRIGTVQEWYLQLEEWEQYKNVVSITGRTGTVQECGISNWKNGNSKRMWYRQLEEWKQY